MNEMKHDPAAAEEAVLDLKTAANFIGFVVRSVRRQRRLVWRCVLLTAALTGVVLPFLPRVYKINTRILTHKSLMMSALVHPERAVPQAADAPTAGAVELIRSRDNLRNLMDDIKLQTAWEAKRSPLSKLKERAMGLVGAKPSQDDIDEIYLKMLDERLDAAVEGEVIKMDVEWPDAEIAMSLAEGAVARFKKMRYDMELGEILETVNILVRNVEGSRVAIEDGLVRMQKLFNRKEQELHGRQTAAAAREAAAHRRRFVAMRKPVGATETDSAAIDMRRVLNEKQAALTALKRAYEARRKKAEDELNTLRGSLGPEHPDVREASRALEGLASPPPELLAMQAEEAKLASQVGPAVAKDSGRVQVQTREEDNSFDMVRVAVSDELFAQIDADPEIVAILDEIKKREASHEDLVHRLASARIESETATAAFEYRYKLTQPPVFPKKYIKPNLPVMAVGGVMVGLIVGLVFAVARDVLSKRVLEAWQIERFVGVRVLGEVEGL